MKESDLGFLCGLLFGLGLFLLLMKLTKKEGFLKCKYDERQKLVQGNGFRYGFQTNICLNLLYILFYSVFQKSYTDLPLTLFIGILAGILVYACYCIWNEGYFSLNEYPRRVVILLLILLAVNGMIAAQMLHGGVDLVCDGMLSFQPWANLFCAAACIIILGVMLMKKCRDHGTCDESAAS